MQSLKVGLMTITMLLCSSALGQSAGLMFTPTDLGTFGGVSSEAKAINDLGQVVGTFGTSKGPMCFLWQQGMPSVTFQGDTFCDALAVDSNGTIAGAIQMNKYGSTLVAFRRDPRGTVKILTPLQPGVNSWGFGVGNKVVVGKSGGQAVKWDYFGTPTALGGGPSEAIGINSSGQIVGWAINRTSMRPQGWLWQNGRFTNLLPLEPNGISFAWAINDNGFVVGRDVDTQVCTPLWFGNTVSNLGCWHTYSATGISNDNWTVVTTWFTYSHDICVYTDCSYVDANGPILIVADPNCRPAYLYSLIDQSHGFWDIQGAWGINNQHQIVGYGYPPGGNDQPHAILLTPNALPLCYPD